MHNDRIWLSDDSDPTVYFFQDEAASNGWSKYCYDILPGDAVERYWWHNEQLRIYFFEKFHAESV